MCAGGYDSTGAAVSVFTSSPGCTGGVDGTVAGASATGAVSGVTLKSCAKACDFGRWESVTTVLRIIVEYILLTPSPTGQSPGEV